VLAAFAEGTLAPERRAEVESHVANCPECPFVVGEVTRFLAEPEEADEASTWQRWWFVAAAVAAICIPLAVWRLRPGADPLRDVRRIAADLPTRGYEGRLHDVPHAPYDGSRGTDDRSVSLAVTTESARLKERGNAPEVLHARGILALVDHHPAEAARLLHAAADAAPTDATIWNDLAAADLARYSLGDHAALPEALTAATRATQLAPTAADAHYNRALALARLDRRKDAAAAFERALALETAAAWRIEIHEQLAQLR
jgi:tetratricopeptide (TPR) repeat protein